jgi:hypothetical protein
MRNGWVVQGKKEDCTLTKEQIDDLRGRMFQKDAAELLGIGIEVLQRRFKLFYPGKKWSTGFNVAGQEYVERLRQHAERVALHDELESRIVEVNPQGTSLLMANTNINPNMAINNNNNNNKNMPLRRRPWSSPRGLRTTGARTLDEPSHSDAHRLAVEHRRADS